MVSDKELYRIIASCQKGKRSSQDWLYQHYYGFAMGVCLRYTQSRDEAAEIVNDGFFKVFTKLEKYTKGLSFMAWLRKIMVNTAIDHYRKNLKFHQHISLTYAHTEPSTESTLDQISEKEILKAIQDLPPSYRAVFNLYVIEGYKHSEIANILGISIGTSKSNLAVARAKLKQTLLRNQKQHIKQQHG
ncbi:sigma-70 family RNA polymerase sigma factor [Rapidithrix thailandica]|uniref:Sigma-70 family RNA polymerase sigma factor n=1 Tax=Rapidithrix thailandica TaxID=413964 RepID=A0AAW9S889_9BACT